MEIVVKGPRPPIWRASTRRSPRCRFARCRWSTARISWRRRPRARERGRQSASDDRTIPDEMTDTSVLRAKQSELHERWARSRLRQRSRSRPSTNSAEGTCHMTARPTMNARRACRSTSREHMMPPESPIPRSRCSSSISPHPLAQAGSRNGPAPAARDPRTPRPTVRVAGKNGEGDGSVSRIHRSLEERGSGASAARRRCTTPAREIDAGGEAPAPDRRTAPSPGTVPRVTVTVSQLAVSCCATVDPYSGP